MNNFETEFFAAGADFDACVVYSEETLLENVNFANLASAIVYTADVSHNNETFVAEKLIERDEIYWETKERFADCAKKYRG